MLRHTGNLCESSKIFFSDYGGNYELPKHRIDEKPNANKKPQLKSDRAYCQLLSFKKLSFISDLSPLNVFLEVTQSDCGFFQCFNEHLNNEFIVLMVKVFAKLCDLPLDEFKQEFLKVFITSELFLDQLGNLIQGVFDNTIVKNKKSIFQININELTDELLIICKHIETNSLQNELITKFVHNFVERLNKAGGKYSTYKTKLTDILKSFNKNTKLEVAKEVCI